MRMPPANLEELRALLAGDIAAAAAFDGWSEAAVRDAAALHGIDPETAVFAFAEGPMAMIEAWVRGIDSAMAAALPPERLATMTIRERIRSLVQVRLDAAAPHKEALRRALAIMALPRNALRTARIGWVSADAMWRLAGDTAADYNHYTKRLTLGSIYAATLAVFINDTSDDHAETRAFLDRRIEGIMKFERAKARLLRNDGDHFSPARLLGRLRYPAR